MKTINLKRKKRLPRFDLDDPQRFATAVSYEQHLLGSLIRIHTINEDGAQKDRIEDWLACDAPQWARKLVGL